MATSDMIVVFPANPTPDLARTLDLGGYRWKAVSGADEAGKCEPQAGWMGAIITCDEDPENGFCEGMGIRSFKAKRCTPEFWISKIALGFRVNIVKLS